jgi:hypothetical protein
VLCVTVGTSGRPLRGQPHGDNPQTDDPPLATAAITGIVVGCVLLVVVLIVVVAIYMRRHSAYSARRHPKSVLDGANVEAYSNTDMRKDRGK